MACFLFFLLRYFLSLPKIRGGGGPNPPPDAISASALTDDDAEERGPFISNHCHVLSDGSLN